MFVVEKNTASEWFSALRDQIINAFVGLEQSHQSGPGAQVPAGVFEVTETRRHSEDGSDAGGGVMSVLRGGRLFEKVGVNVSTVHGHLAASAQVAMAARKSLPGMKEDPRFWASGISLVAHMQNPHCPAVHMNTRMFWTPHGWWFGGGSDLNPCLSMMRIPRIFMILRRVFLRRMVPTSIRALKNGRMIISISRIANVRGVSGAFSWMTIVQGTGLQILP